MAIAKRNAKKRKLENLCSVLAPILMQENYDSALAIAVLVIVYVDSASYTLALNEAQSQFFSVQDGVAALQDKYSLAAPINGEELYSIIEDCPLSLLLWLDHMLTVQHRGELGFPEWVYLGNVLVVKLSDEVRSRLKIAYEIEDVYLCRKVSRTSYRSSVEKQGLSPDLYTPNWHVVADSPDRRQPSRKVEVHVPNQTFQSACDALQKKGKINLYLAEFNVTPSFDSHFVQCGSRQTWAALGLQNERELIQEVIEHLNRAVDMNADVVIFPELTFPPGVLEAASNWLNLQPGNDNDGHFIQWIVAGSFHCNLAKSDILLNKSLMLDRFGNIVTIGSTSIEKEWAHNKLTSVRLGDVMEANQPGDTLTLAHTPLGLQAIVICLDLAQMASVDSVPLELLPLRWLWVPSMSAGVTAHEGRAKELGVNRVITVVCANQARAKFSEDFSLNGDMLQSFISNGNIPLHTQTDKFPSNGSNWKFFAVNHGEENA